MVNWATIIADVLWYLRDFLASNISDPITRPSGERFVMTSYPSRAVTYPIITIKDMNSEDEGMLGFQSEAAKHYITIEIRVWVRTTKERDQMSDEIYQELKDNQIGTTGTSQAFDLHGLKLLSRININEDKIKSKVFQIQFLFIAT